MVQLGTTAGGGEDRGMALRVRALAGGRIANAVKLETTAGGAEARDRTKGLEQIRAAGIGRNSSGEDEAPASF